MFLSGVLSKRDGRAEEPDVDGVALALPPVAGKGDRQLGATDGHAPVHLMIVGSLVSAN